LGNKCVLSFIIIIIKFIMGSCHGIDNVASSTSKFIMGKCQGIDNVASSTSSGMDISLYYFPPWNRAEPMRMLMMHAGVTFNDVIV
jgi:hypothetical protein